MSSSASHAVKPSGGSSLWAAAVWASALLRYREARRSASAAARRKCPIASAWLRRAKAVRPGWAGSNCLRPPLRILRTAALHCHSWGAANAANLANSVRHSQNSQHSQGVRQTKPARSQVSHSQNSQHSQGGYHPKCGERCQRRAWSTPAALTLLPSNSTRPSASRRSMASLRRSAVRRLDGPIRGMPFRATQPTRSTSQR